MEINKNLHLVLRDIFLYDIKSCHYTILDNLGFDLSHINKDDKKTRNIQIGQMMRENPRLTSLLRNTTESVIDDYILKNNIHEDEIVIRQYDGMILTRKIEFTNIKHIPFDLRNVFQIFITSIDHKKYIGLDNNNEIIIKGIPFRYKAIDDLYTKICKIAMLGNKSSIFRNLQKLKDDFLNSKDPNIFGIPTKSGKSNVFLKGYGEMEISESTLKIMDTDDIDKNRYFQFYIQPFTKSIVFEYVR